MNQVVRKLYVFNIVDRKMFDVIVGAAVFFPDKEARRKQLFNMMTDINVSRHEVSHMNGGEEIV